MTLLDQLEGVHRRILNPSGGCHNCPRKLIDYVPATLVKGPVLWLGEAPGATEVEQQEGFVGQSGEVLRKNAKEAGVPGPWSFSNTVHCRPPGNAQPSVKEVQCCLSQFVLDEIRGYQMVVLCGSVPLQALFPGATASHFRGNVAHHGDFPGQRFYTIYHPAYILRRPDLEEEFQTLLARLSRIVRGESAQPWALVRGAAGLEALRIALQSPLISLDLETTRLESWVTGGRIRSFTATADGNTVAGMFMDDPYFAAGLGLVVEYLKQPEKSVIGSYIGFDLEWLEREYQFCVACQLIHETGVAWYEAKQYKMPSLKELVSQQLDGYRWLVHEPHKEPDVDLLLRYNAEDVVYPLQLLRKSVRILKPQTHDLVTRVLGPVELVLREMTATGFYLRQAYRKQKIDEYRERRRVVVQAWEEEDPEFVPTEHESGNGLKRYLFDIRKLPVLAKTNKGEPSTDKAVVKQWVRDGWTTGTHLLSLKEIDKIESTYLTAYDKFLWPDSRLRSSYTLTLTDSGRSSSRQPNLQNIPRDPEIRDLFGCPPGSVLIESDLNQIEFRMMVCLAQDETGIAAYLRGEDAHTTTAKAFAGEHYTKEDRSNAKPVNFSLVYAGDAYGVQRMARDDYGLDWSLEQAQRFTTAFFSTYKRLPVFHDQSRTKLIYNRGWFQSVVGHVFYYAGWDHEDQGKRDHIFRAALNAEAQGPAAQLCFYIMVLARRLLNERGFQTVQFVNTVHDSIITEVPNPAWVPVVIETIDEAAAQAYAWVRSWLVVPLIMEHAVGESWGSLEGWKKAV